MAGHLAGRPMWDRYDHHLGVPPPGQGRVRPNTNAAAGNPPISGPGMPVPPIGGSTTHATPAPLRLAGGGKLSPRGGHFYFALPPGHFYSGLTTRPRLDTPSTRPRLDLAAGPDIA